MVAALSRPALRDVDVAPMRHRHLRGVLAIEQLVFPRPWTPGLFAAELGAGESRRYVVALAPTRERALVVGTRRPARVVGYGGIIVQVGEAHVTTLAAHPEQHRRKIASRVLVRLMEEAVAMGAEAATLEVRAANRGAQRLYGEFGFVPAGLRPGYYAETGEDALIMWVYDLRSPAFAERLRRQAARLDAPGGASGAADLEVPWVRGRIGLHPDDPESGRRAAGPGGAGGGETPRGGLR